MRTFLATLCVTFAALVSSHALAKTDAPVVTVQEAKQIKLFDDITYPARVVADVNAAILAPIDGVVVKIKAPLGKRVRGGEGLLAIQHNDPVYQYVPVTVNAPIAGVVSGFEVSEGSVVTRGQKLASITEPTRVRIQIEVAVSDLKDIAQGARATFSVTSKPEPIEVRVKGISPVVDSVTATATCELETVKPSTLAPGQIGRVSFRVRERAGIQIPEDALVYRGKETFVRVIEGNKAKQVAVTIASTNRGQAEVSGLKAGTQYVVRASSFVADGEEVTIQSAEAK